MNIATPRSTDKAPSSSLPSVAPPSGVVPDTVQPSLLGASNLPPSTCPGQIPIRFIRLALALFGIILILNVSCEKENKAAPYNVLLITIDTLRADSLGCYGSRRARTPVIDRLAASGTLFENVACPMPLTRPSHFSIFTSRYPRQHSVMNNLMNLPPEELTLAEILQEKGYRTTGFSSIKLLDQKSGTAQGFDSFFSPQYPQIPADLMGYLATLWINNFGTSDPFFMWLHLFDPHMPYSPPPQFIAGSQQEARTLPPSITWDFLLAVGEKYNGDIPPEILNRSLDLYSGEVSFVDHILGMVAKVLQQHNLLDRTIIVLTGDHGESFSHGVFFEHSDSLYDGSVAVPLIFRCPGKVPSGERNSMQCDLLDVAPTILALLDIDRSSLPFEGRNLFDPDKSNEVSAFAQHPVDMGQDAWWRPEREEKIRSVAGQPVTYLKAGDEQTGLRSEGWKYLVNMNTGAEELYNLKFDPHEMKNMAGQNPEIAERFRAQIQEWQKTYPIQIQQSSEPDEELLQTLKALGYIDR
ncbi:sulfatase [Acidobacteriota bacterium]